MSKTIEVGHIFKLGTFYADPFALSVLDENGRSVPIVMGSYGIGVERNMAVILANRHINADQQANDAIKYGGCQKSPSYLIHITTHDKR
jgi:prolyl-tRNA synthetase